MSTAPRRSTGSVATAPPLVGIFVGGSATRFGGVAKGLLRATPDGPTIVEHLLAASAEAMPGADVRLVGAHPAYGSLGMPTLVDPAAIGPMGGLLALLAAAAAEHVPAVALACDMPFVTVELLRRLSSYAPSAAATAPRRDGRWHPLFARYLPGPALPAARACVREGRLGLYCVFQRLGPDAVELPLSEAEAAALRDWDEPGDVGPPPAE
jgi:molybdopterin-guanine dinucleotide biosynthesis protein A